MGAYIKNFKMPPPGKYRACVIVDDFGARLTVDVATSYADHDLRLYPIVPVPTNMGDAIGKVISERKRQMELWGDQSDNHPFEWMSILGEEFGELCEAVNETCFQNGTHPERGGQDKIIKEATQVAAVAVAIIESAMRKKGTEE